MEFVIEFIFINILSAPGAFIRWGLTGFKKGKLKYYLAKDAYHNTFIFLCVLLPCVFMVKWAIR